MQAGFTACTQAVTYHILVLTGLRKEVDELKQANIIKDAKIGELEEAKAKMTATIEKHEEARVRMAGEHEEARDRMGATLEDLKEAKVSMAAAIEDLERRMREIQQNGGNKTVKYLIIQHNMHCPYL